MKANINGACPQLLNKVTLSASPHPGWEFSHWEILRDTGWEAVRNSNGLPLEGDLNIWMNWWDDPVNPGRHVPWDEPIFNVKAVFLQPWVILLSGECEFSGSIASCDGSGMNTVLLPSLLANSCYDASFFNEDVVAPDSGDGELYEILVDKLQSLSVKSIDLVGHSHGGGSIYNLCKRFQLDDSNMAHNEYGVRKINVIMTGYVDAIKEETYTYEVLIDLPPEPPFTQVITVDPEENMSAENRCPEGVQYYSNLYQLISTFLNGTMIECVSNPNRDINCLDTVTGVTHTSIDDNVIVTQIMKNRLDYYIYGNDMLSFFYWGNVDSGPCE